MQNTNYTKNFNHIAISGALGGYGGGLLYSISEDWRSAFSRKNYNIFGPRAFITSLIATSSISFSFYELLKGRVFKDYQPYSPFFAFTSGFFAGAVAATPIENYILLKNRYQITAIQAVSLIMKQGPSPLFMALPEIALKEAAFATAMLWAVAESRKQVVENRTSPNLKDLSTLSVGLAAAIITQPLDKIAEIKQNSNGILSTVDVFKKIMMKNYWPLELFKGLSRRIVIFTGSIHVIPYIQNASYIALEKITFKK